MQDDEGNLHLEGHRSWSDSVFFLSVSTDSTSRHEGTQTFILSRHHYFQVSKASVFESNSYNSNSSQFHSREPRFGACFQLVWNLMSCLERMSHVTDCIMKWWLWWWPQPIISFTDCIDAVWEKQKDIFIIVTSLRPWIIHLQPGHDLATLYRRVVLVAFVVPVRQ